MRHRLDVDVLAQALRAGVREVVQADDRTAWPRPAAASWR